ncbi:hypothetical protein TGRH88_077290 [Toxoplasma gondii]|uniref:Uncharacterized protein n=1 Tax=Toxoplasma gondii TaxID=5811 RepID=A0A7J6K4F0_TOXGO|nr:hypothetical protein TGRH88_077290 [Toxoplasma gondii]
MSAVLSGAEDLISILTYKRKHISCHSKRIVARWHFLQKNHILSVLFAPLCRAARSTSEISDHANGDAQLEAKTAVVYLFLNGA